MGKKVFYISEKNNSKMRKKAKLAEAKAILRKVPTGISFWLCTNEQLRSLNQLWKALENADDEVFRYHVNRDKNDFEAWIREVIKDKELAREISRIKTKSTLIRKIRERVEELKKIAQKGEKPKKAKTKGKKTRKKLKRKSKTGKTKTKIRKKSKRKGKTKKKSKRRRKK